VNPLFASMLAMRVARLRFGEPAAPLGAFCFDLRFMFTSLGSFSEVNGLESEIETEDYHEGGNGQFVHRLPKGRTSGRLVLRIGMTPDAFLFHWFNLYAMTYRVSPVHLTLHLRRPDRSEARTWGITNAYPVKWSGPSFKAQSGDVAIEAIELAHEGIWACP
jgi:phage tail-like protein